MYWTFVCDALNWPYTCPYFHWFFFVFLKEWFTVLLFPYSNPDGCETSIVLEALMKFLFFIWVIYLIELFVDSVSKFYRFWKRWCYSWFRFFSMFCFRDGFFREMFVNEPINCSEKRFKRQIRFFFRQCKNFIPFNYLKIFLIWLLSGQQALKSWWLCFFL